MHKGKPAKKYSQAGRVHDIIRLIESRHGITIEELMEETGVTRRTIHRDLNAIHEAGYPLVADREGSRKVYRFLTRFKDVPPINFTLQELATLYFLRSQAEMLIGTPFEEELESVFRKIRSVLPPRYAAHMERISGVAFPLIQGRHDYRPFRESLEKVRDALIRQNRINLGYLPTGRDTAVSYLVDPYTLIFYKSGLYLVGYAHNRQDLRTFAIDRIQTVTVEPERFEMPESYRPEERLSGAFGIVSEESMAVRVRFSPVVAHAVKGRIWHPSQTLEDLPDGGVELSFNAGGKMEIIAWILSYGEHAEVLAPIGLRSDVAKAAKKLDGIYQGVPVERLASDRQR